MSSGEQEGKTKQEMLKEYEKRYLARLEKAELEEKPRESELESNISSNLQNLIFKTSAEFKTNVIKDYIGHCVVCKKVVERNKMIYEKNHLFHANCFEQHGNDFQATTNLMNEERRAKVDLAYLKNLKVRSDKSSGWNPHNKKKSTRKTKKKANRRKKSRKRKTKTKRKIRRSKPKKRKTTKKRKSPRKHSLKKRKSKKRTSRKKVRRRSTRQKTKRRR